MCASAPKVSTSNIRQRTNIYDHVYLFFCQWKGAVFRPDSAVFTLNQSLSDILVGLQQIKHHRCICCLIFANMKTYFGGYKMDKDAGSHFVSLKFSVKNHFKRSLWRHIVLNIGIFFFFPNLLNDFLSSTSTGGSSELSSPLNITRRSRNIKDVKQIEQLCQFSKPIHLRFRHCPSAKLSILR